MVREELAISIGAAIGAQLQSRPVERVLGVGTSGAGCHSGGAAVGDAWLALEWIQSRPPSRSTDFLLGEQLARQHR
jgi:hypothetical protein